MEVLFVLAVLFLALAVLFAMNRHQRAIKNRKRTRAEIYDDYISSPEWQKLRLEALEFFNYRCVACNSPINPEVHHRWYPPRLGDEKVKINGRVGHLVVLCRDHHHMAPRSRGLYKS